MVRFGFRAASLPPFRTSSRWMSFLASDIAFSLKLFTMRKRPYTISRCGQSSRNASWQPEFMSLATASAPAIHSMPARSTKPYTTCFFLPWATQRACPVSRSAMMAAWRWPSCSLNSSVPMRFGGLSGSLRRLCPSLGPSSSHSRSSRFRPMSFTALRHSPVTCAVSFSVKPYAGRPSAQRASASVRMWPSALKGMGSARHHPHSGQRILCRSMHSLDRVPPMGMCRSMHGAVPFLWSAPPHSGQHVLMAI